MKLNKLTDTAVICFLIILSLLPFMSILFTPLNPHTHDGLVHLARIGAYYKALLDGQFPVRWAGDLNYGYGMPLFNFIYQVPYFISSFFLFLGSGLVLSYKLTLALSFVLSGIFAFFLGKELFNDQKKAFFFTIFYQFAPFRLVELLVRGDIGEVYAYTFLPLVCWGLTKLARKFSLGIFFITGIATALLILSHNSLSLSFFAVCVGFIFIFPINKKSLVSSFTALGIGLALSAFYWIPALAEHKYTYGDLFMKNIYLEHFAPLQNFFIPNFFNSKQLQTGGISVQFGLFHTIALFLSLWGFFTKNSIKEYKKIVGFGLLVTVVALFFMQPISKFLWANLSLLRQFQFSWRLLGVVAFGTSLLSIGFFYLKIKKGWIGIVLLFFVVISTAWYWVPPLGYDKINENYYWNFPLNTTYFGETDVIWSAGPAKAYPKERVEFAAGMGSIRNFTKNSFKQSFTVTSTTAATLVNHTEYFPGWRVTVNGKNVPIEFQDQNYRGEITFAIPAGENKVSVIFGESKIRFIADIVSLVTVLSILVLFAARRVYAIKK